MSTAQEQRQDPVLTGDVLQHLTAQLQSARRLQAIVLEQSGAIRRRAVPQIVKLAAAMQGEMHRREVIEMERTELMDRAALVLDSPAAEININGLTALMDPASAHAARELSNELRRALAEIQREHTTNRALMQQELSFLDHLLRLAGSPGVYSGEGRRASAAKHRGMPRRPMIELEA